MQNWVAFYTLAYKEVKRFMRIWTQTLIPPIITTTLYFIIFGQLIGARIGEMAGVSYMQFIAPGLIMMSAITGSYSNVVSSFFLSKFIRNIEDLLISPVSNHTIILGFISGGVLRGIIIGILVTSVALCFVSYDIFSWSIIALTLIMTTIVFSLAGLINAIFARSFDDINIVPTFVLTPLTYLGGVFYSISLLPPFWQIVSKFNPIVYMINGFRYGFLGVSDVPIIYTFTILTTFVVILYSIAYWLVSRGIGLRS